MRGVMAVLTTLSGFAFQLAVSEDLIFLKEVLQWHTLALEMFITTGHVEHISSLYVL